ncbi:tyrosine-type recombinase/integrase [Sandaracinus amylolyticus]|uniref:Integrase n=1 Tax=Sandaracinus amylolyticus TaxID=927083 RepID=A0A0F6YKW0_9BACT|nr:site-specific integrase [Sandaracinus amylolyticus]AKF08841.1 Integrase [Sandaracinus amylolyticus]
MQRLPDGRYRLRGEYVDPKTGKRRELDRRVEAADDLDAASIRAKLLDEATAGRAERRARARLGEALDAWLASKVLTIRPSTHDRYTTAVEKWKGAIGEYFLDAIEPDDVRGVLAGWRDNERATETINGRLRVLRTFAKDTRAPHIVDGVAALPTTLEEDEAAEDEGRGLTVDELRSLLDVGPRAPLLLLREDKKTPRFKTLPKGWARAWALVATLAWTGLRPAEAAALRWDDVDLEAGVLRIRRSHWRGIIGHPKARASKRRVAIAPELASLLRAHRETMLRQQWAGTESGLVFPSPRYGRPSKAKRRKGELVELTTNTYARKTIEKMIEAAGIDLGERPALYCLRHTMNNLVRQHATEEVRRSIIGHAEEVETYTHVAIEEQRAAFSRVTAVVRARALSEA